ncbi:hypothetical protein COLO4_04110, partial [Corchorus olitorius]
RMPHGPADARGTRRGAAAHPQAPGLRRRHQRQRAGRFHTSRPRQALSAAARRCLLEQAFGLHRGLHGRAGQHALAVGQEVGQLGDVHAHELGPARHGEQVGVGHGELLAHQVVASIELAVHPLEAVQHALAHHGLVVVGRGGVEQGTEALVQLGADEVQPLLQVVAGHGAVGRGQLLLGDQIGQVLDDGRAFMQRVAVVEHEEGNIAQRVDAVVVRAVLQLVRLGAGQDRLVGQACLVQDDVGRQRAGARAVVELHGGWLPIRVRKTSAHANPMWRGCA